MSKTKMNQIYLKEHLCDELEDSKEYIKRAIEIKAMDQSWAKMLFEMGSDELKHAGYLYKMAEDYYKKVSSAYSTPPEYMEDCMEEIVEMYTEEYASIKKMQDIFSK